MNILSYKNLNDLLTISWQLTLKCNYKCPYCSENNEKEKYNCNSQQYVEKAAGKIKEIIIQNKTPVRIHLTGGEPSIYDLKKIIKILDNEYIQNYSITTNLSRDIGYYFNLTRFYKKISFSASLHETECNYNEFIKKANIIPNLKVYMVATNYNTSIIEQVSKKLKCQYIIRPEYDKNYNLISFSEFNSKVKSNYVEIINKNGIKEIFSNQSDIWKKYGSLNFYGYKCKRNFFKIKPNGDIYNGSCNYIINKGKFGNIFESNIIFKTNEEICKSNINCNLCGKIEVCSCM